MSRPSLNKKNEIPDLQLKRGFVGDKLYSDLKKHISSSEPHQAILGERRLKDKYNISFITTRKIVDQLVSEKLLYRVHGKGTFVAERAPQNNRDRKTILYIDDWAQSDHPYCIRKLRGILDGAEAGGFNVQVHACRDFSMKLTNEQRMNASFMKEIGRKDVVGIIIPWLNETLYTEIKRRNESLHVVVEQLLKPLKDTACVEYNLFSMGYQAIQYFSRRNIRTVLMAYKHLQNLKGGETALQESEHAMDMQSILWNTEKNVEPVCEKILKIKPQGLAFDDDRMALLVIKTLKQADPKFLKAVQIISSTNVGEDILPPEIARLNLDSYEKGIISMSLLKSMIEGRPMTETVIRIDPKLVESSIKAPISK